MVDLPVRCSSPWRTFLVALIVALGCGIAPAAGAASAPLVQEPAAPGQLPIPGAFQVTGTNGYTMYVIAEPPRSGRPASVSLYVLAKGMGAIYRAPATVTETMIQADLGVLGEISVDFQRTNQPASAQCGKRTLEFDSGLYEGKIDFHGEGGFTDVEATSAPGDIEYELSALCGRGFSEGDPSHHARGAELYLRNPALGPRLSVRKRRPGAAALIEAWAREYTNGISITRIASQWMPGRDFTFDPRLQRATLRPPAPFAGTAQFDRGEKAGRRWSGNLTVDLPGENAVALTGPTLRAYLIPSE